MRTWWQLFALSILALALAGAHAKTTIFTDTFGSSTTNQTSVPGGTPTASSTSYDIACTKDGRTCTIGANQLRMKLAGSTTGGWIEMQAIFASSAVQLTNIGDSLNVTFVFTNSAGTLLAGGNKSVISVGLYNSGGVTPVSGGGICNAGLGNVTTFVTGYCQNWQGYVGQINYSGSSSAIFTRPIQSAANNANQDLLFSGFGTGLYGTPAGTTITNMTSAVTLTSGATYTRSFTITLSASNEVTVSDALYSGTVAAGIPLSNMSKKTSGGTTYTNFSNQYDALAIGIGNGGTSFNPQMDISQITITKSTSADNPYLYNVQLNGFTNNTYSGAAQIGTAGDVWNNPDWTGVYTGSTNLIPSVPLRDSSGASNGVTLTMTAAYNNNTTDWNDGGVFNHYTGQTAGSATPVLMDQLVKVDYSGTVNVMTMNFAGLPVNTPVTAYVYGAGNGSGQGGIWTMDAGNGGAYAAFGYDGSATGRDVTLASSRGISWQSLSGTTDASGKLTITVTGTHTNSIWWQTYMNGIQLQVGGVAPTIFGLTNQTVEAGTTVLLNPLVTANPTATYQWMENGVNISGATNASLTLTNVSISQSNYVYSLAANNAVGGATNSMTLYVTVPVYSTMSVTAVSPNNGASGICYDTPLTVTFSDNVTLGTSGSIKIFAVTNGTLPIDTISAASGLVQQRAFPGDAQSFSYQTIQITGNTVKIYPHFNTLNSNQTYYVTIDPKTFKDSGGTNFVGLSDTNAWQFSTKSGPADPSNPTVNANGSADFLTVQGAVNSIPSGNTTPKVIYLNNGEYNEIVDIAAKNNVTFRGQSRNAVRVGFANNSTFQAANSGTTHARMAFKVKANDITFDTLTVTNRTPQGGSQAEALMIESSAQRCIVENCEIASRQDTILANVNSSQAYFHNSKIIGNFDYIWGGGNLFFRNCEIRTIPGASGFNVTAARTDTNVTQSASFPWANPGGSYTANGMSFVNCTFTADTGVGAVTLAGSNGTAGNNVSWYGCDFATNYVSPASQFSGNFVWWQAQNTMTNTPVTFALLTTISGSDSRLLAATNITTWFYGWNPALAPEILTQPTSATNTAGATATLSVGATGIPDVTYQWLQDGTNAPYPTANSATLSIPNVQPTDAAPFSVIVANSQGSVTSSIVTLTVIVPAPPVFGTTPQVQNNGSVQFSFSGTQDATYRVWASTNIALTPVTSTWTLVSSGTFGASPVSFTDSNATNYPQRFYIISSP